MNPNLGGQDETKTIKYSNKNNQEPDQNSQIVTEKLYMEDKKSEEKSLNDRKKGKKQANRSKYLKQMKTKIVVIQTLQNFDNQKGKIEKIIKTTKSKHRKGKSMQFDEFKIGPKYIKRDHYPHDYNGQRNHIHGGMSARQKICKSEMKNYSNNTKKCISKNGKNFQQKYFEKGVSKALTDRDYLPKKKSRHCSSQIKTNIKKKQKIKSLQLLRTNRQIAPKRQNDMQKISYSLPMTTKMINLISSPSFITLNQDIDLRKVHQKYIIPTQQSIQQAKQIRQYEKSLSKTHQSNSLRQFKRLNPILSQVSQNGNKQTINIINQYIQAFEKPSNFHIKSYNSQLQLNQMLENLNLSNKVSDYMFQDKNKQSNISAIQSYQYLKQKQQNENLDSLIHQLTEKAGKLTPQQKSMLLVKIEKLIKVKPKDQDTISEQKKQSEISNLYSMSSSLKSQQNVPNINIEILDEALRKREKYLLERKQKQLESLQERQVKERYEDQAEKIEKWINRELRDVKQARTQLWKGFNQAKDIVFLEKSSSKKQKLMIKSLSEKYLTKSSKKSNSKSSKKQQSISSSQKEVDEQPNDLTQGRISQEHEKLGIRQSIVKIQVDNQDQNEDQQYNNILNQNSDKQVYAEDSQSESLSDQDNQKINNILNQATRISSPSTNQVNQFQNIGLNLQQIKCEIDEQNSFDEEQLKQLQRQSQKALKESFKIPSTLTEEDKEDIFQFIFLDLCIELTDQYNFDSSIMKKIREFIRVIKEQSNKKKGFKTNSSVIKQYLFQIITFLKTKENLLNQIYVKLDQPLGPTALDILKYMHANDEEQGEDDTGESVFIMDIKIFQEFQAFYLPKIQLQNYYNDEQKQKKRKNFLKNAIHIHNKAIFDSLNEALDKQRPYGVWGEPFPWKKQAKFVHRQNPKSKNNILLLSAQQTVQNAAYMCGFMIDKEQCQLNGNPNVSQQYLQKIRQDRLSRLLANELQENEEKMLFIDDEQTQILVQISNTIMLQLINESMLRLIA